MEMVLAELLDQSDPHPVPLRLFIHRLLTKQRHTRTHPVGTAALFPAENDKAPDQSVGRFVTEFLWMEMGVIHANDAAAFRPAVLLVPTVRRFDSCTLPRGCFRCCHPVGGAVQNFPGNFYNSFLLTILTER